MVWFGQILMLLYFYHPIYMIIDLQLRIEILFYHPFAFLLILHIASSQISGPEKGPFTQPDYLSNSSVEVWIFCLHDALRLSGHKLLLLRVSRAELSWAELHHCPWYIAESHYPVVSHTTLSVSEKYFCSWLHATAEKEWWELLKRKRNSERRPELGEQNMI